VYQTYATLLSFVYSAKDRLAREQKGATAVEYGLLVGLIAIVIIGAVFALGGHLSDLFTKVDTKITNPGG
jgi:pilus assembly protein Flp/PilA